MSEVVRLVAVVVVSIVTDLMGQLLAEGVIPLERMLNTNVNYYKIEKYHLGKIQETEINRLYSGNG